MLENLDIWGNFKSVISRTGRLMENAKNILSGENLGKIFLKHPYP